MKKFVLGLAMAIAVIAWGAAFAQAADTALLDSDINTKEFFRRRYFSCAPGTYLGAREYERYFRGWQYVLGGQIHNGRIPGLAAPSAAIPYDLLKDADITEARFAELGTKVLILSNTASLSAEQSKVIQQWVLKGGKLIATYGSGYKDIIENPHDPDGADPLKSQKGSTGGLHELWHDPWTKAFGTQALDPAPGVDVMVTKAFGPTNLSQADIASLPFWPILPYGAQANLLVPRPEQFRDALAFLKLSPPASHGKMYPAILLTRMSRGTVVYFAYAPEFIVALAFDLAGHCGNDTVNYPNESTAEGPQEAAPLTNQFANIHRVRPQLLIMKRTIDFMLTGN